MNFKAHASLGATVSIFATVVAYLLTKNPESSISTGAACFAGSIFPDVDHKSHPSKIMAASIIILFAYKLHFNQSLIIPAVMTGVFLFAQAFKHRAWTHKYTLAIAMFGCSWIWPSLLWWGFGIGLLTHYACDKMNPLNVKNWV